MSKNLKELIDYLESIKNVSEADTKVLIDGEAIEDFEDVIGVNHERNELNPPSTC